jgi:hypothetical protein
VRLVAWDFDCTLSSLERPTAEDGVDWSAWISPVVRRAVREFARSGRTQAVVSYGTREVVLASIRAAGITAELVPDALVYTDRTVPKSEVLDRARVAVGNGQLMPGEVALIDDNEQNAADVAAHGYVAVQVPRIGCGAVGAFLTPDDDAADFRRWWRRFSRVRSRWWTAA